VFPYDPAAERSVWDRVPSAGSATSIAILTPGAGWGAKQWPPARYADVARALANDGVRSLVNYSPAEEALAREVEQASAGAATPVLCTISELIALTRRAALFIGGDTGPMHLANALGVPVVALFGPTEPARTGPYPPMRSEIGNQKSESVGEVPGKTDLADAGNAIVLRHPASRTDRRHRPEPDPGLLQISGDEVISAARELLTANPGTRHPTRDPRHPDAQSPNPNAHSPEPLS
jgi:heptosyltransferase-1